MSSLNGRALNPFDSFNATVDRMIVDADVARPEAPAPDSATPLAAPGTERPGANPITSSNSSVRDRGFVEDDSPIAAENWPAPPEELAYYGMAGDFVRVLAPHTEADPVALLIQLLVVFGNMIGRSPYFIAEAARHHMNLFTVLVGRTSKGRKGSSWSQVFAAAGAVDPGWTRRIQGGLSSGEGLIWAVRNAIDKQEPTRERGSRAVTGYQTVRVDEGVGDKRLLTLESEFALVLKNLARDGNTLSAIIRQAWDTGDLRTLTKNNTGSTIFLRALLRPSHAEAMMGPDPKGPDMHVADHLTTDQLRALADAASGKRRFLRIRAVLLAAEGRTAPEVAAALGCSRRAAQAWVARYNDEGEAAFDERPRTGRPPFLDDEAAGRLRARLDAGPVAEDAACTLRGPEVRALLEREFGVTYSLPAVYALLHRLGYSCLDPRPRHRKADPEAQEDFKKKSPAASTRSPASTPASGSRSGSRTRRGSGRRGR